LKQFGSEFRAAFATKASWRLQFDPATKTALEFLGV
jgi:hypothetical protein